MGNEQINNLKFLAKRFIDFAEGNNWNLSLGKETLAAYAQCLKEAEKYEEGERNKKAWVALEALMEQETSEMEHRFTDLRQKAEEVNEIAKKLSPQVSAILEEYMSDDYNVNNIKAKIKLVVQISDLFNQKSQAVASSYPKIVNQGGPGSSIHPMGTTFWRLNSIKSMAEEALQQLENVINGSYHKNTVKGSLEHIVFWLQLATDQEHEEVVESIESNRTEYCTDKHPQAIELIQEIRSKM